MEKYSDLHAEAEAAFEKERAPFIQEGLLGCWAVYLGHHRQFIATESSSVTRWLDSRQNPDMYSVRHIWYESAIDSIDVEFSEDKTSLT
jgi:hypothetical protein